LADDPNPRMIVIAGPPGGGKSTSFPASDFGVDFFNADDAVAALNYGSHLRIPLAIREVANQNFEEFVRRNIASRRSFAIETTLRSEITFTQAEAAANAGFQLEMRYLALPSVDIHIQRVRMRGLRGGHSAPESVIRAIYHASLANLGLAIREFHLVRVYDNGAWGGVPELLLQSEHGVIIWFRRSPPAWLSQALKITLE
jgi:predicted ABC-type ATPase